MKRVVIYTKDIMIITGKSERSSRDLLKRIKTHFGKEEYQYLSITEFCQYTGLNEEEIQKRIY